MFFAWIMIKINKVFILILVAAFLSNNSAYGIELEWKPCLRVPINRETMERLERVAANDVNIEPGLIPLFIHEYCNISQICISSWSLLRNTKALSEDSNNVINEEMKIIKEITSRLGRLREELSTGRTMTAAEIDNLTKTAKPLINRGIAVSKELYDLSIKSKIQTVSENGHTAKDYQLFKESIEALHHLFLGVTSSELAKSRFDINRIFNRGSMTYEIKLADYRELSLLFKQGQGGIKLVTNLDSKVKEIYADKFKLRQVMINLIKNAAEAIPDGGTLTVKTELKDNDVVISISDTGVGISRDNLAKIFDPFYSTKASSSMGVGLAVSKEIIEDHGGRIEVESELGKGTTFKVILPIGQYDGESITKEALRTLPLETIISDRPSPLSGKIIGSSAVRVCQ